MGGSQCRIGEAGVSKALDEVVVKGRGEIKPSLLSGPRRKEDICGAGDVMRD